MPEDTLAGRSVAIGADESTRLRVVITGLQVIEPGFIIVVIATVAQGVDACHAAGGGNDLAVGVIFVGCYGDSVSVDQPDNIALQVQDIVVICAVVVQRKGFAVGIVEEVQVIVTVEFPHQLAVVVDINGSGAAVYCFCCTQAIFRVVEGNINAIIVGSVQSAKLAPNKVPAGAVVVAGGISGIVIGIVGILPSLGC